jgi:hypothetical protein
MTTTTDHLRILCHLREDGAAEAHYRRNVLEQTASSEQLPHSAVGPDG